MKKAHLIALYCLVGVSSIGQAQTAQVHIAGSDYPVTFADTNLSFTVRQRIASDLTVVFSPAPSFEELGKGKGGYVTKADVELEKAGFLTPDSNISLFPTREKLDGVFIVTQDNQRSVHVNQVAFSNYVHAFKLIHTHSNEVKKAHEFVAVMSRPDLSTQPIQFLKSLCHVPPLSRDENLSDEEVTRFFTEMLGTVRYPGISALHFFVQKRPEFDGAEVLGMYLYMIETQDPDTLGSVFGLTILFHNGKWGFGRSPYAL